MGSNTGYKGNNMTDETGVSEGVAAPQAEPEVAQNDQEMNWQRAQETMAEQKRALDEAQRQNQTYQQQLNVFQNYMNNQQQQQVAQPASPLESISDDDVVTGADMKRAMNSFLSEKERVFQQKLEEQQSQLSVMGLRSQYSDYDNAVQNTVKMAENDPQLAEALRTSSNPGLLAYQLGKAQVAQPNEQAAAAKKIVENSQKPGSVSQAATGGSALSKVDFFSDLSDKDFEEHVAKVKRGLI